MAMLTLLKRSAAAAVGGGSSSGVAWSRAFASLAVGTDIVSAAPGVSLQKARTWDEGVASKFSTTPLSHIFKGELKFWKRVVFGSPFYLGGNHLSVVCLDRMCILQENLDKKVVIFGLPGAYTGVCSAQHVPSYKNNFEKFKAKGVDSVICVAVNDPYTLNGWAEKLQAKEAIEFYGDFDGSFHKSFDLVVDLSAALLGHRSQRWSAYVVDGKVKVLNVEKAPSEVKVSGGEAILDQI